MDAYEKFLADLKQTLDVDLSGYKRPQMERRINALMRILDQKDYSSFIKTMQQDKQVFARFIDHLTINVSEFFRNLSQWEVLANQILPVLLSQSPNLKIWSAGCSTGEEPYTMAMVLAEHAPWGQHFILATDYDERVLKVAQEGYYSQKAAAGVPGPYLKKYFNSKGEGFEVKDVLRKAITFRRHNLLRDRFPDMMDLIICRNVVIYFTEETKNELYKKLYSALKPGGVLYTGSTEQIIQAREIGFESMAIFFYRRAK